ncbi:MAG TPA: EAL domain-containing protein [Jatrophihabitans sp.]|nr:EAL domain-containing protein [Jatrophihabitans sp.]
MSIEFASATSRSAAELATALDGLQVYLQPIISTSTGNVWAYEALARFHDMSMRSVDDAIAYAHRAGYGAALEVACLRAALDRRAQLPEGVRLALNLSPDVLSSPLVMQTLDVDLDSVIVELTEHRQSADATIVNAQLERLRRRGALIAVDDVGSGYAGLLRLATLRPDFVKLDRTIVSGVRQSEAQSAVLEALVTFSHRLGAEVVGEGVETLDDLARIVELDVDYGQGWAVAVPAANPGRVSAAVVATCRQARQNVLQRHGSGAAAAARAHRMHSLVGALGGATGLPALHVAVAEAARDLRVDVISASVLGDDGRLRELTSSGQAIDVRAYALSDYPTTRAVIDKGIVVEVHANDPEADPAETAVLRSQGGQSLLIVPLEMGGARIGVLEFVHRTHRRWTSTDIADARGLATHMSNALVRLTR